MDWGFVKQHLYFSHRKGKRFLRAHPMPPDQRLDFPFHPQPTILLSLYINKGGIHFLLNKFVKAELDAEMVFPKSWTINKLAHCYTIFEAFKEERNDFIQYAYTSLVVSSAIGNGYLLRKLHIPQELLDYIVSFYHSPPALKF